MKLSRGWKLFIGVLTIMQLFIALGLIIFFFVTLLPMLVAGSQDINGLIAYSFGGLLLAIILLSIVSFALSVFYIIHAGTNNALSSTMKLVWILLFLLFSGIVEVVYYFMEILPNESLTARFERTDISNRH